MPHAELKYSKNLDIDAPAILEAIEATILRHDASAGECKGRAYPTADYHHTHILASVSLLTKAHRDDEFTRTLLADLEQSIKAFIHQPCQFSLGINFSDAAYVTNLHQPSQ